MQTCSRLPPCTGEYLAPDCVSAIGGSWMVPQAKVDAQQFEDIAQLTRDAVALVQ